MQQIFETPPFTHPNREYRFCPICGQALVAFQEGDQPRRKCPDCGFIHYLNPSTGVVTLITHGQSILLGRRGAASFKAGEWCLPGGFIEYDENFLTAAHREVREETGLAVQIQSIINVCSNFLSPNLHTLVIVLLASPVSGPQRPDGVPGDDLVELRWFAADDPLPPLAFEADAFIIRHFFSGRYSALPVDPRYSTSF